MMIDHDHRLVAILRGVHADEIEGHVGALIDAGFRALEIPLNSPDPFDAIPRAVRAADRLAPGECLVGAGTVMTADEARRVADAGGRLCVSPNCDPAVIGAAKAAGMMSLPGVMTPTEAFTALAAGADGLKLFPAFLVGPAGLKAIRAVLPSHARVWGVGGLGADDLEEWIRAGAWGFGLGSDIYRPGAAPDEIGAKAARLIEAFAIARRFRSGDHERGSGA